MTDAQFSVDGDYLDADNTTIGGRWSDAHKASQIIMRALGLLTLLASICPMMEAWADHRAGKGSPISRVIFSAMVGSVCRCIAYVFGSLATPTNELEANMPWWLSSGSVTTCNIQGFFSVWGGLTLAAWDTVLSIFYVLTIRFSLTDDQLRKIEFRFLHLIIWPCTTAFSIAALLTASYNSITDYCWLATSPQSCVMGQNIEELPPCTRGRHSLPFTGIYFSVIFVAMFVAALSMILIYQTVLHREELNKRYSFEVGVRSKGERVGSSLRSSSGPSVSTKSVSGEVHLHRRSREVAIQGLWYASTIIVSALPLSVVKLVYFFSGSTELISSQTSMHLCNIHGFLYLYTFLRRRTQLRTSYGRFVRWLLFDCIGSVLSRLCCCGKHFSFEFCILPGLRASSGDVAEQREIPRGPRSKQNKPVAALQTYSEEPSMSHFGEVGPIQGPSGHESSTANLYASGGMSEMSNSLDIVYADEVCTDADT